MTTWYKRANINSKFDARGRWIWRISQQNINKKIQEDLEVSQKQK